MRIQIRTIGVRACLLGLIGILLGCQQLSNIGKSAPDTRAEDEKTIREADTEWSKAMAAKDIERVMSYYAEDGTLFPSNAALAMGKPAIRVAWTSLMATPGFAMNWAPMKVEVAKAGDLGYSFGTYSLNMTDPQGKPVNDRGKYVVVWKKQPDGNWKAVVDIGNSDLAPAGTPPQKEAGQLRPPPPA